MPKKKEVQCWRHRSITSAWKSNVVVPATKTTERMQTTIQLSLLTELAEKLSRNFLYKRSLVCFLIILIIGDNQESYTWNHSLLPLFLRVKEFSQRINITGPKLPLCCLTFFFTCFTISPCWCKEGRKLWGNHILHTNVAHGKTPSLSLKGQEIAVQCKQVETLFLKWAGWA